jgi:HEAT repeat protein
MFSATRQLLVLGLALLAGLSAELTTAAQTTVPRENIPGELSAEVKKAIEGLYSDDLVTSANAARALGRMGDAGAAGVPFLIGMLGDTKHDVLRTSTGFTLIVMAGQEASNALARIGQPSVAALRSALEAEDSQVRWMAARALGVMSHPAGMETLTASLASPKPELRKLAVRGLGESSQPEANALLLKSLQDKDAAVRSQAAEALGRKEGNEVIGALIALLEKEKITEVRQAASKSLEQVTREKLGEDAAAWRAWWTKKQAE